MNHTREAISATTPMAPKLAPWAAGEASLQKNRTLAAFFPKAEVTDQMHSAILPHTARGCHGIRPPSRRAACEGGGVLSVSQILPHTARVPYGRRRGARPVKGGVLSVSQNNDSVLLTCSVILSVSLF